MRKLQEKSKNWTTIDQLLVQNRCTRKFKDTFKTNDFKIKLLAKVEFCLNFRSHLLSKRGNINLVIIKSSNILI